MLAKKDAELKEIKTRKLVLDKGTVTETTTTTANPVFSPARPPMPSNFASAANKPTGSFTRQQNQDIEDVVVGGVTDQQRP